MAATALLLLALLLVAAPQRAAAELERRGGKDIQEPVWDAPSNAGLKPERWSAYNVTQYYQMIDGEDAKGTIVSRQGAEDSRCMPAALERTCPSPLSPPLSLAPPSLQVFFHGCSRTARAFWPFHPTECPECMGFPEHVSHTKQALAAGFNVVVRGARLRTWPVWLMLAAAAGARVCLTCLRSPLPWTGHGPHRRQARVLEQRGARGVRERPAARRGGAGQVCAAARPGRQARLPVSSGLTGAAVRVNLRES